jgi:aryl-alcohol dehydrogenase-like predicted oxidoreductase
MSLSRLLSISGEYCLWRTSPFVGDILYVKKQPLMSTIENTQLHEIPQPTARIGIGTWVMGGWMWGGTKDEDSLHTLRQAFEMGLNFIDTAPVYGFGRAEEVVGKALKENGRREAFTLATKVGLEWDEQGKIRRNSSPERIRREVEDSLRRLQTDYIDVYIIHWPDVQRPLQEAAEAMHKLKEAGKIRSIGVSNYSAEQINIFRQYAPLHLVQPPYNLFERGIEADVLPTARQYDIKTMTYGAICRGLLSGKMQSDTTFEGDDLRRKDPKFRTPRYRQYLAAVEDLDRFAQERHGKRVIHLAVRWILDMGVDTALWGLRKPEQLDALEASMNWHLSEEDLREIDRILDKHIEEPLEPVFMAPPA